MNNEIINYRDYLAEAKGCDDLLNLVQRRIQQAFVDGFDEGYEKAAVEIKRLKEIIALGGKDD